jgi:HlyD family secretion protein
MDAKVGSIAGANTELIAIISKNTPQIESYVPEVDIAVVAVGNSASTTLDAYGAATTFAATVVSIDPAQTVRGGVSTYKTTLTFLKNDSRIKPGMTAAVTIATGIVPDAIIVPKGAIFTKNGTDTIELLVNEKTVEVSVITQPTSLGSVVVTSGLKDGDVVILNPEAQ